MKWYIAARRSKVETVKSLISILKGHGHQMIYDWTNMGKLSHMKKM